MALRGVDPWKFTAIGMGVVMVTALITGLVVAGWNGLDEEPGQRVASATLVPSTPNQSAIDACNKYATSEAGARDKALEVVKDVAIGAVAGAAVGGTGGGLVGAGGGTLYGLNENRKHDGRYRTAYASCMRARGHNS